MEIKNAPTIILEKTASEIILDQSTKDIFLLAIESLKEIEQNINVDDALIVDGKESCDGIDIVQCIYTLESLLSK